MTTINDGGHAFPLPSVQDSDGLWHEAHTGDAGNRGMTLRDYFAAKAMHADLVYQGLEGRADLGHVAAMAYEMADAMIAARGAA